MSPKIVLYRKDGACSFIPHALRNELHIPHESVVLDMIDGVMTSADGSFSNADYKAIHPSGCVPALKIDDDEIITERPAILTYIAALAPERKVFGSTPLETAKVYEWVIFIANTLHGQGYGALWRPGRFTDDESEAVLKAITEKGRKTIMETYARIERNLEGEFAVGNGFTVVDLDLHTFWRWGAFRVASSPDEFIREFPKLSALAKRVEGMESMRETLRQENQPLAF